MTDSHDFPTELPADPAGEPGALRWTAGVLALAASALALLNAEAITGWAGELPPSPTTARVMMVADAWQAGTARLGLDAPHAGLHSEWKRAQAMRWPVNREELASAEDADSDPLANPHQVGS